MSSIYTSTSSKLVILIRGLQSTGKSTLARFFLMAFHLMEKNAFVRCADDYFYLDNPETFEGPSDAECQGLEYKYRKDEISQAHMWCVKQAHSLLSKDDTKAVIIPNTFSQRWEMEPYINAAHEHKAELVVIDLFDAGLAVVELAHCNSHGVPESTVQAMKDRWEYNWGIGDPRAPWRRDTPKPEPKAGLFRRLVTALRG